MDMSDDEMRVEADFKARGLMPDREEIGGDYYYRCGYIMCNAIVKKTDNYCKECGMKILWEER